jgi:hypothetical protein
MFEWWCQQAQSGWFNSCKNVDNSKNVKIFIKRFICKCKILSCMCLVYYDKCKMQFVSNGFNILKVNGSTMIIEKMWKKKITNSF